MARKLFWKPYTKGVQTNEGHTVIKSESYDQIPEFLRVPYEDKETDDGQEVIQKITGKGKNYSKRGKLEAEINVIKVLSGEGISRMYNMDLVKKVEKKDAKMYVSRLVSTLLIINKDGSCGIVACCIPDKFEVA